MVEKQSLLEAARATCKKGGFRLTNQRRLVLEVLSTSQEHLDAESIYQQAKARDPRISLATVYRSLTWLCEIGLVTEHPLGENHSHFETNPSIPHYHFSCLKCGKVIEFDAPEVLEISRRLSKSQGMQIIEMHLHLSGTCAECLAGNARSNSTSSETR
jgi:Fur family ferric uptake transcriptional regulator